MILLIGTDYCPELPQVALCTATLRRVLRTKEVSVPKLL